MPVIISTFTVITAMKCFINLGNTCYFNAAIHAFLSLQRVRELVTQNASNDPSIVFFKRYYVEEDNCPQSPFLIYQLYLNKWSSVTTYGPEDALECLTRLIDLFESLWINYRFVNNRPSSSECPCTDIPVNLFTGVGCQILQCQRCGNQHCSFEKVGLITLPATNPQCKTVSSCISNIINEIDRVHGVRCDNCNECTTTCRTFQFHVLPPVLVLDLVNAEDFQIENKLSLRHGHTARGEELNSYEYELRSVIMYNGSHYTCAMPESHTSNSAIVYDDSTIMQGVSSLKDFGNPRALIFEWIL